MQDKLSTKTLLKFSSSEELISYLDSIRRSDELVYSKNISDLGYIYLCNSLIKLAKLESPKFSFDLVQECIPYFLEKTDLAELSAEYDVGEVFKARIIWNAYTGLLDTLESNIEHFNKFIDTYKPLVIIDAIFNNTSVEAIASMTEEEFIGYLSTCDVDDNAKNMITALYSALSEIASTEAKKYAIEDLFINQAPLIHDTRIDIKERVDLGMIQILAYDEDIAMDLRIGYANNISIFSMT